MNILEATFLSNHHETGQNDYLHKFYALFIYRQTGVNNLVTRNENRKGV